jgi:hypothetical protein
MMLRNVSLEVGSHLRLKSTTLLRACMPRYANVVNISKMRLDGASLLRLIFTPFLRACMPSHANIVNMSKV